MFLNKFFAWLSNLFSAMQRAYKKLTIVEQELSVKASAIIAIINANLLESPNVVFSLIQSKYPEITREEISKYLAGIKAVIGIADDAAKKTLETNLIDLQNYLAIHDRNIWVHRTQTLVGALIAILLPSSPLEKIVSVLEYIYQKLVKNKI